MRCFHLFLSKNQKNKWHKITIAYIYIYITSLWVNTLVNIRKYNIQIKNLHFVQISPPNLKFPLNYISSSFGFLWVPLPFSYFALLMQYSFCNISCIIFRFLSSASSSNLYSLTIFLSNSPPLSCSFMISSCNSAILLIVILCVNLCVHIRKTHYNNNGWIITAMRHICHYVQLIW